MRFAVLLLTSLLALNRSNANEISNTAGAINSGSLSQSAYQAQECQDIKPGDHRTVNESGAESSTGIPRRYRVGRDSKDPQQLNLDLNIDFQAPQPDFSGSKEDINAELKKFDETNQSFHDRAQSCFNTYKDRLRDSQGNKLAVNIMSDHHNTEVPVNYVKIVDPQRSNSENWSREVPCTTIIHECLHLTGLVDAYVENDKSEKGGKKYDCRHTEKESVMNNQIEALEDDAEVNVCSCNTDDCSAKTKEKKKNEMEMSEVGSVGCPKGYVGTPTKMKLSAAKAWAEKLKDRDATLVRIKVTKEQTRPALNKAEVTTITQPRCTKNAVYMDCSKNAYRTKSEGGCAETSPECQSPDWAQ